MAPVEPEARSQSNALPIALFAGPTLLVVAVSAHVLYIARRAAHALPPSTTTRSQQPLRRRHAAIFSVLAFLSLASVTTFAVVWRALSYLEWAEKGNHETPGSLWTGWYGTGEEGVGRWRLGDWLSDVHLGQEADTVAVLNPHGFIYTSQHWLGLAASSMFMGIEGKRRNISASAIISFIYLGAAGSLSYALCLFFVTMLYTPLAQHSDDTPRHDALFAPKPVVYYVPIVASVLSLYTWPKFLVGNGDSWLPRVGYSAVPLVLAFAPQIIPTSWGHQHVSKASAHRSFIKPFHALSVASLLLYWNLFASSVFYNTPPEQASVYDLVKNSIGRQDHSRSNRLLIGISDTAQKLKLISTHPAISVTSVDVLFTAISLLAWAFTRNLDTDSILENSFLSPLAAYKEEKHVEFEEKVETIEEESGAHPPVTPKRRGRPKKNANGASAPAVPASVRRSTRRKTRSDYESDAESTYEPPASAKKEMAQTETDGTTDVEDIISGGESTALAMFLSFAGGLGQLAASVLGSEVTGVYE